MKNHINILAKKEKDLIMSCFKKQKGFISIEESKHLIEIKKIIKLEEHVGTDYFFNGKVILTIYPMKISEENGRFNATINYSEYENVCCGRCDGHSDECGPNNYIPVKLWMPLPNPPKI